MKSFADEDQQLKGMYWVRDAGACSGVYVIEEGRTLIDAGNMYGLVDELQDLGPLDRLERILLTHAHFDHVGGVQEIFQLATPTVYVHPMTREYLKLLRAPFPDFFEALEKDGKLEIINDGDTIEGSPSLRVIHTPGHTAGDVSFFDEHSGALFTGDAVLPSKERLATPLSKPDEFLGGRLKDKVSTLKRLLKLPARHLFAGHGEPVFHKATDQIKISLYSLYQAIHEEFPERAWIAVGYDLFEAGMREDARQCAAKAQQLAPESEEVHEYLRRVSGE